MKMKFLNRIIKNPVIIVLNIYFKTAIVNIYKTYNKLSIYLINILICVFLFLVLIKILGLLSYLCSLYGMDFFSYAIPSGDSSSNGNVDPVRWWPSGVPQGWSIVGTGLATFAALSKLPGVSPRMRVLGALGASGVTATNITYHSAIENPVGFNRFMWSMTEYQRTGIWPSIEQANQASQQAVENVVKTSMNHVDNSVVDKIVSEVSSKNNFLPSLDFDFSLFITRLSDLIFKETMQLLQPVYVEGFFDDLIGQRMFVEVLLLILAISLVLLFIVFIFNVIFLLNKDWIIKKFNNKFISLYIKYQSFLSKITLVYVPILIFIGLFTLCQGLHWLIINQIPYESLEIDLHKYVSSSFLFIILNPNKFNIYNYENKNNITHHINKKRSYFTAKAKLIQKHMKDGNINKNKIILRTFENISNSPELNSLNKYDSHSRTIIPSILKKKTKYLKDTKKVISRLSNLTSIYNSDSPIFKELLINLINGPFDEQTQLKIEYFLKNQYAVLNKSQLDSADNNIYSNLTNLIIKELYESKENLVKLINNYKKNIIIEDKNLSSEVNNIIYKTDIEFIINITYGRLLRIISDNQHINNHTIMLEVIMDLGSELINQYLFKSYELEKNQSDIKISFLMWKKSKAGASLVNSMENPQLVFELGSKLINWIVELELIKVSIKILAKNEKINILVCGAKLEKLISTIKEKPVFNLPYKIPMIVKPKLYKWENNDYFQLGGYLLNDLEFTDKIFLSNKEISNESKLLPNNIICDMVNNINSVAFKINENVLDFILKNNKKYNFYIESNYNHPLTLKNKLTPIEVKELEGFYSRRYLEQNILGLAIIFREVPSFYIPVRLDYRGRLYCITEYFNYQNIDLAKSLIEFSVGEKIFLSDEESINYLKIYCANSFGNKIEKKSFNDRIKWVNENIENIINFENGILISQAENKLAFVAFCFEYIKYTQAINRKEEYFISNLPIQLDASCNGFQHLTLLIDDVALSKELNLGVATWDDIPKDFYSFVGLKVKNYFINQLFDLKETLTDMEKKSFQKLASLNIHRNLIKKAVMTIPYNASPSSIVDYIKEEFDKIENPNYKNENIVSTDGFDSATVREDLKSNKGSLEIQHNKNKNKNYNKNKDYYIYKLKSDPSVVFFDYDFQILRKALNLVILVDYPKLTLLLKYLKDVANVSNKLNLAIPWSLPSGLVVNQQFFLKDTIKVKPFKYTKNLLNLSINLKNEFNQNKQKIALMPNLVHSLDAASLCLVIGNYFKENNNFFSIHDCFAVPCNKVKILTTLLKSAYCVIYTNNKYLIDFHSNFITNIKRCYGEDSVSLDEEKNKLTVITNSEEITVKCPSIKSIIDSDISKIDVSNSTYLIH
jgi:hypothetical protein